MEEKILPLSHEQRLPTQRERAGRQPEYVFHEGPPTANGHPGIHHVAHAFKDIFPRYKTMQGYYVQRRGGWDTRDLPLRKSRSRRSWG